MVARRCSCATRSTTTTLGSPPRRASSGVHLPNRILSGAVGSIIAGGGYEEINGVGNYISDSFCAILGGRDNQAGDNIVGIREQYATCVGGYSNYAGSDYSFVGGGFDNLAAGEGSAVVGGAQNEAEGGPYNFIGGGLLNDMAGGSGSNSYSVITGGRENVTEALYATVPGGYLNYAGGNYSFAAGRRAKANDAGSFVWGDSLNADFGSTAPDQFLVRARGGVGLNTSTPLSPLHVSNWVLGFDASSIRNDDIVVESDDSIIGLYSTGSGSWGSGLMLAEGDGTGMLLDKWALVRQSSGASSRLHLTYGSDPAYSMNPRIMSFNTTGQVGIGIAPIYPLHMASGARCTVGGTWTNASSRALKENITPVDRREVLGRVLDLPVSK